MSAAVAGSLSVGTFAHKPSNSRACPASRRSARCSRAATNLPIEASRVVNRKRERGEGSRLAVICGKECVAQGVKCLGPPQIIGNARRSGEVGDASLAVGFEQAGSGITANVSHQLAETNGVAGFVSEIAILSGI